MGTGSEQAFIACSALGAYIVGLLCTNRVFNSVPISQKSGNERANDNRDLLVQAIPTFCGLAGGVIANCIIS